MEIIKRLPKHLLVASSSWISRGILTVVQILSVRYLIEILGHEKYAAFILLSGLLAWSSLSDFGLGNSVLSVISEKRAENKKYKHLLLSSFLISLLFFILVGVIVYFLSETLSGYYLKSFDSNVINNKSQTFFIALMLFVWSTLAGLIYKVWYAEQVGWLSNFFPAIAAIIGFFGIYILSSNTVDESFDILEVFLIFFLPVALISSILLIWKIIKVGSYNLKIKRNLKIINILLKRARPFFLFSILGVIVLQTDLIVISQKLEVKDIILYGVLLKIFNVIYFIYSSVLQAWWPVCTELIIQKKIKKLKQGIRYSILLGVISIAFLGFLVYEFEDYIFSLLNIGAVNSNSTIYILFSVYFMVRAWCDTYAVLLQTMNYMKPLLLIVPLQILMNFSFQWIFASYFGLNGILMGLVLSFVLTVAIYLPLQFNKQIKIGVNSDE